MALETIIREMHCPKCTQNFEEGSRRFCPTDGARLISDNFDVDTQGRGIFANLLPKTEPAGIMDEKLDDKPTFSIIDEGPDLFEERKTGTSDNLFKLDVPLAP